MRIWKEGDMQLKFIELIKSFNGHHGNQIKDVISLPNGTFVSCGADKSI